MSFVESFVSRSQDRELLGIENDVARIQVAWYKNKGKENETSGAAIVEIPISVDAALESIGAEELLESSARMRVLDASNRARASVSDPDKMKKRAQNAAERLKNAAAELGIDINDLLNM